MTAPDPTPANAARLAMRCVELKGEVERLRTEMHTAAEKIDAYLSENYAAPMWWHLSDIAHVAAGCIWDDNAGDDGAYDCEARA